MKWHNTLSLTLITLMVVNSTRVLARAQGTESGGGGDPVAIESVAYPDTESLRRAIEYSERAVGSSSIPLKMKEQFLNEISNLEANNKFRMLPAIIVLGSNVPGGYSSSLRQDKFTTLSAMTLFEKGANVYLAQRVLGKSISEMGVLLVHEVLHHIIPKGLSEDEEFVGMLTRSILINKANPEVNRALTVKGYFKPGKISRTAFLDSSRLKEETLNHFKTSKQSILAKKIHLQEWNLFTSKLDVAFEKALPENLADSTFFELRERVHKEVTRILPADVNVPARFDYLKTIELVMIKFAQKVNPGFKFKDEGSWGCNTEVQSTFFPCDKVNYKILNEIF